METDENPQGVSNDSHTTRKEDNGLIESNNIGILSNNINLSTITSLVDSDNTDNSTLGRILVRLI